MSGSVFGTAFKIMTFGESHGPFIGVVIDGIQPGLPIDVSQIQRELDRRKPGQSNIVTPRKEEDKVEIISGVFEGKTTGTPICMLIKNKDQRSKDYGNLKKIFRPGHAGYTFLQKYGIFDYRGGGRASGRETACRVAAGAVAKGFLKEKGIEIYGYTKQINRIIAETIDLSVIEKNPVRCPDLKAAEKMVAAVLNAREEEDSLGGVVEILIRNCPTGLGEPVFHKLEADLAGALMSIGAVKAFEMGNGVQAALMKGSKNNDCFRYDETEQRFRTHTNNAGGVLGGISNGEDLVMRITIKPPSSISKTQHTVDHEGHPVDLKVEGRHDPCICPRVVPVAEAMTALVLMDHFLMQERISTENHAENLQGKVDHIDHQILLLLAQRKNLSQALRSLSTPHQPSQNNPSMQQSSLKKWRETAKILELSEDISEKLAKTIMEISQTPQI